MGQKVHPYGMRLGIVTDWKSRWYSKKDYADQVVEDSRVRDYLTGELTRGAVSRIDIERIGDKKVQVDVHTARPGVVIGRSGSEAERLRSGLEDMTGRRVKFNVIEVKDPETDAQLLARGVADQLQGRVSFRRAMKRAVATAMKAGAQGVRVQCAGRLGGSDMGRREWYREGRVPLHTLRADIDYGAATARTPQGAIGVKVWVYKGDVLPSLSATREKIAAEAALAAGGPASRRAPAKARVEAAAGEDTGPRLIEAGGGKRLIEAGGGKRKEGGKRLIEAGGGKRISAEEASAEFQQARQESTEALAEDAPAGAPGSTEPVAEAPASAEPVAEAPASAEHVAEAPGSTEPVAEAPASAEPVAEAPASAEPVAEAPASAEPVAEAPASAEAESAEADSDASDDASIDEEPS